MRNLTLCLLTALMLWSCYQALPGAIDHEIDRSDRTGRIYAEALWTNK